MAKSKYADMGTDALTAEIKARRAAGRKLSVDLRSGEDKLRAALETDDLENGEFDPAAPTEDPAKLAGSGTLAPKPEANALPKPKLPPKPVLPPELRNQVSSQAEAPASAPTQPGEDEFSKGALYRHKGDGLVYQVIVRASDAFEKPVKARVPEQDSGHPGFYWEGTTAERDAVFEKL